MFRFDPVAVCDRMPADDPVAVCDHIGSARPRLLSFKVAIRDLKNSNSPVVS